jgi:hypothetical protein
LEHLLNARSFIATCLFLTGLVINPAYFLGCAAEEEELKFDYGEEEMLGLLDDLNTVEAWTMETEEGAVYTLELALTQAEAEDETAALRTGSGAWAQTARACGTKRRMFGASASACSTHYETLLPLEGTLVVSTERDGKRVVIADEDVFGNLAVDSPRFEQGPVRLDLEGADGRFNLNGSTLDGLKWGTLDATNTDGAALRISGELTPLSSR